jgi:hypothetical protein
MNSAAVCYLKHALQGCHASWEVLELFSWNFKALESPENQFCPGKLRILERAGILRCIEWNKLAYFSDASCHIEFGTCILTEDKQILERAERIMVRHVSHMEEQNVLW